MAGKDDEQPKQFTQKGNEIPIPNRQAFIRNLNRTIKADPKKVEPKPKRPKPQKESTNQP
jgi:hypothetical protein